MVQVFLMKDSNWPQYEAMKEIGAMYTGRQNLRQCTSILLSRLNARVAKDSRQIITSQYRTRQANTAQHTTQQKYNTRSFNICALLSWNCTRKHGAVSLLFDSLSCPSTICIFTHTRVPGLSPMCWPCSHVHSVWLTARHYIYAHLYLAFREATFITTFLTEWKS